MFSLTKSVVLFLTLFGTIESACRQSFVPICDDFNDISNATGSQEWTELMIGSPERNSSTKLTTFNLMYIAFTKLNKLRTLIISNKLQDVATVYGYQCTFHSRMEVLIFYGNEINRLKVYTFPMIPYKKLGLSHNNIEFIDHSSFFAHEIGYLDLSHNKIEVIDTEVFSSGTIRALDLRHNQLSHINTGGLSTATEALYLDHNKLRYLDKEVVQSLTKLRELTMSHNKFTTFPGIPVFDDLQILDLSNNQIPSVPKDFLMKFSALQILDLSANRIDDDSFLVKLLDSENHPKLQIAVGYNRLEALRLENTTLRDQKLSLYGNPWNCEYWGTIWPRLEKNLNDCDKKQFTNDKVPYCLNLKHGAYIFATLRSVDVNRFIDIVNKEKWSITCNLSPDKVALNAPVGYGCVA